MEIIIKGKAKEGKTTIAALIASALMEKGISCRIRDVLGEYDMTAEKLAIGPNNKIEERLHQTKVYQISLCDVPLIIKEEQLPRNPV